LYSVQTENLAQPGFVHCFKAKATVTTHENGKDGNPVVKHDTPQVELLQFSDLKEK